MIIFVYDKNDDHFTQSTNLDFIHCAFISKDRTADYTTTKRLIEMIKDCANEEDIYAFLADKNLPADEISLNRIVQKIMEKEPEQGFLTISNALQWRLQYQRIVSLNESVSGIVKIIDKTGKS